MSCTALYWIGFQGGGAYTYQRSMAAVAGQDPRLKGEAAGQTPFHSSCPRNLPAASHNSTSYKLHAVSRNIYKVHVTSHKVTRRMLRGTPEMQ